MMCITPATLRTAVSALTILILLALACQQAQGQCQIQRFVSPDQFPEDIFGGAVGVHEDIAAIGNLLAFGGLGIVYVYRYDPLSMQWLQEAELSSPEPDPEAEFGSRLAVHDQCILVAAGNATGAEPVSGAAYAYRRQDGEWTYEAKLMASDGEGGDLFGSWVALDSDLAIVGARDDVVEGMSQAGSAHVFRHIEGQWVEEARLHAPEPEVYQLFGQSVAIRPDFALVGAHGADSGDGAAFVFHREGGEWVFEAKLTEPDPIGQDWLGYSVAIGGTPPVAAIGAPQDEGQDGAVYVFRRDAGQWAFEAKLLASNPVGPAAILGATVALNRAGETLLAGAPWDRALGFDSGAAHVFRHDGTQWYETAKLLASDGAPYAHFGAPVSLSGDMALVGAPSAAAAYMFAGFSAPDCNHNDQPDSCDIFEDVSEDLNANGIPDECEAIGDLDGNGVVNVRDLLALLGAWGACDDPCPPACTGDTNGDCQVDYLDLLTLLSNWGAQ